MYILILPFVVYWIVYILKTYLINIYSLLCLTCREANCTKSNFDEQKFETSLMSSLYWEVWCTFLLCFYNFYFIAIVLVKLCY
jgi:hypothetical protein